MDPRIVDRVEGWDTRPLEGGFAGIRPLIDQGFSGAVSAGGCWLFLLNGRGVGIFDGTVDAFEGTVGTIYGAPDPALPLLFTMQSAGGETYATYYTNDTPLAEVDDTLTDANFTGYVELSENVLSGDYYVVYYGGRSMSAAFVGSSERLITGEDAFEKASDEVGIYEVTKIDLDLVEIPEPDAAAGGSASADTASDPSADPSVAAGSAAPDLSIDPSDPVDDPADDGNESASDPAAQAAAATEPTAADADETESEATDGTAEAASPGLDDLDPENLSPEKSASDDSPEQTDPVDGPDEAAGPGQPPSTEERQAPAAETGSKSGSDRSGQPTDGAEGRQSSRPAPESPQPGEPSQAESSEAAGAEPEGDGTEADPFSEEAQWRESRTVPALNPEESSAQDAEVAEPRKDRPTTGGMSETATKRQSVGESAGSASVPDDASHDHRIQELQSALEEAESGMEALRGQYEDATQERDALREERDRLERRIEQLENERDAAHSSAGSGDGSPAATAMARADALDQTDLFVRYGSKGKATLETAHGGGTTPEEVVENLRLEHHTRFDGASVTVDGESFSRFLENTIEYRFVEWLVEHLLFEIAGTNSRAKLRDLYDALPAIDRVEFDGAVTSRDESGEEERRTFDVVVRDRMGQPLIVANINDGRDPATGDMMESLVDAATTVAEGHDTLAAAFLVTASFFKPEALESATEATGSGLLSREKRASFVKLSRKRGYHLCLAETRGNDFHVTVPEL